MALKQFNVNEDVVTTEITVTDGFFDGGKGIVAGTSLTTSSLSTDQKKYYYNLQFNSKDHLENLRLFLEEKIENLDFKVNKISKDLLKEAKRLLPNSNYVILSSISIMIYIHGTEQGPAK